MTAPARLNFKLYQGSTFNEVFRWEGPTKTYKTITGMTQAAPLVITSTAHGLPAGWRFKVTNVVGMTDMNSTSEYRIATLTDTNTITVNDVNAAGFKAYVSGGIIEYNTPKSLVGVTAKMQLRTSLASTDIIDEYSTTNGKIIIDDTAKTITINVDATTTAGYTFGSAVYSLEITAGPTVIQLASGTITLVKEVTR